MELLNIRKPKQTGNSGFQLALVTSTIFWMPSFSSLSLALLLFTASLTTLFAQQINTKLIGSYPDGYGSTPPYLYGASSVFVLGNYAYIVSGQTLEILDITLPRQPVHIGGLVNGQGGAVLTKSGYSDGIVNHILMQVFVSTDASGRTYAYAPSNGGLEIIDVTNPAAPTHVSWTNGPPGGRWVAGGIFVLGNIAYTTGDDLVLS